MFPLCRLLFYDRRNVRRFGLLLDIDRLKQFVEGGVDAKVIVHIFEALYIGRKSFLLCDNPLTDKTG
jgi:hypothetical protein